VAWFSPAEDLYSSAFDYAEFLTGFLAGKLVPDTTVALALADPVAAYRPAPVPRWYGMHWEIYSSGLASGAAGVASGAGGSGPSGGLPAFGHRGASGTVGIAIPDANAIVVYLTNSQETDVVEEVIAAALELFGG
jgi:CubicO group peptidase (beta-lactamase class C family)